MIVPLTRTTKIQKIRTGYIRSVTLHISAGEHRLKSDDKVINPYGL